MAGVGIWVQYVSVLIISDIGLKVRAACNPYPAVPGIRHNGTRHNGTLASGDVVYFTCDDTGYIPNINPPISTCRDNGAWDPPEVMCEINMDSLVIAIVVAISAVVLFAVFAILIIRTKRRHRNTLKTKASKAPKVKRRSPKFPEYPPETFEMSRPGSLYDSVTIDAGDKSKTSDPHHQLDNHDDPTRLSKVGEEVDETPEGLQNPGLVDDEGVDVIDAGGLKTTGAIAAGNSQSPDHENKGIKGEAPSVKIHSYENTPLPKSNGKLSH